MGKWNEGFKANNIEILYIPEIIICMIVFKKNTVTNGLVLGAIGISVKFMKRSPYRSVSIH